MNISFETLQAQLEQVLRQLNFDEERASLCSRIFAENSRDGVYSHGLSRFPAFVKLVKEGAINIHAEPECEQTQGVIEYWNGHLAPGMYAATRAMERAVVIAKENGMGAVSIKNGNHWMRGGTYGLIAADAGCVGICATNAIGSMPAWNGSKPKLGNNPLVFAFPSNGGPVVLDMAISQYSYGKMNEYKMKGEVLPFEGGYDNQGNLTKDPSAIITSKRPLPIGLWKGSGLAMILDILTAALSGGNTVAAITKSGKEIGLSQFFLAIDAQHLDASLIEEIIAYTKEGEKANVSFPGEHMMQTRKKNLAEGIPVNDVIWNEVLAM